MRSCVIDVAGDEIPTHHMRIVNDKYMRCYCGHLSYELGKDKKSFIRIDKCKPDDHQFESLSGPIVRCRCGKVTIRRRNGKWKKPMKKWRIDFTIERYGDMIIEADTQEEARKIFDKKAREQIKFTHGHTYDWDVRTNYAVEAEDKPPFEYYNRPGIKPEGRLIEELTSPLYSEDGTVMVGASDPLVSYLSNAVSSAADDFADGPNDLPWV